MGKCSPCSWKKAVNRNQTPNDLDGRFSKVFKVDILNIFKVSEEKYVRITHPLDVFDSSLEMAEERLINCTPVKI